VSAAGDHRLVGRGGGNGDAQHARCSEVKKDSFARGAENDGSGDRTRV